MFRIVKDLDIKFMSIRRIPLMISTFLIIISLSSIGLKGFNFGIDFSSGYIVQLKFDNQVTVADVQNKLYKNNLNDVSVQLYGSNSEILIKLRDEELFKKTNINNFCFSNNHFFIKHRIKRLQFRYRFFKWVYCAIKI